MFNVLQSEVEERIARIKDHKGVKGLLIVKQKEDKEGSLPQFVKSTMPEGQEATNHQHLNHLIQKL